MPCVHGALHRNDIRDVARFFAARHYGKFLVFNLCEEHEANANGNYDRTLLFGQVVICMCVYIYVCMYVSMCIYV